MAIGQDRWLAAIALGAACLVVGCEDSCPDGQEHYADEATCHPLCQTSGASCAPTTGSSGVCLPAGADGTVQHDGGGGLVGPPGSAVAIRRLCMPSCVFAEGGSNRVAAVDGGTPPVGICPAELQCTWVAGSVDPGAALIAACLPR